MIDKLAPVSPRDIRKMLLDSLGYAVAAGRQEVMADDLLPKPAQGKPQIGF